MTGQREIAATWMRGGTSKGVFFRHCATLPHGMRSSRCRAARPRCCCARSAAPTATPSSSTAWAAPPRATSEDRAPLAPRRGPTHDVDYLFGAVAIEAPVIDWSGNCGNLSAAVGPFAIACGLVDPARVPRDGVCTVRIWQANIGKTIVAHVPISSGQVAGDRRLRARWRDLPGGRGAAGLHRPGRRRGGRWRRRDVPHRQARSTILEVPGVAHLQGHAGRRGHSHHLRQRPPTSGYGGTELAGRDQRRTPRLLAMFETIRAHARREAWA
jgi:hypothetical protein